MLKSLDVLIGISLVMLLVSMVVTLLTQFFTSIANTRGTCLRHGLRDLISHLDPALTEKIAGQIADAVLKHPLIGNTGPFTFAHLCLGTVIHRDELTAMLIGVASDDGWTSVHADAKKALVTALKNNGIANPSSALNSIRTVGLSLEESHPELATNVRHDLAILQAAKTNLVAKINAWFDQTIDRVSSRFTAGARAITFACALIVALLLQLDTIKLANDLWTNDILRDTLVAQAQTTAGAQQASPAAAKFDEVALGKLSDLAANGVIHVPDIKKVDDIVPVPERVPGIVLSAFLLSLGAPFWYSALKSLLRLRESIADKDDAQRTARQSEGVIGPPPPGGAGSAAAASSPDGVQTITLPGERGDLAASG